MLAICSGAQAKLSVSEAARGQGEANGLDGGARGSPEKRAGVGDDGGELLSGTGRRAISSLGTSGARIGGAHEVHRAQAKLVTRLGRRMRGWNGELGGGGARRRQWR